MKEAIINYKLEIAGALAGAASGFAYWYFVGCAGGTCAITSSPINSTLYGAILGALTFGIFKPQKQTKDKNKQV